MGKISFLWKSVKKNTLFHANDLTLISITDILKKNVEGEQNMKCPYCNNPDTKVIDSRPADDGSRSVVAVPVMSVESGLQLMKKLRRFH